MRRVGLYGGAFDPVHTGHIVISQRVKDYFELDKIIFIPAKVPPHKSSITASAKDRLNMLKIALKDIGEDFEISDIELRSNKISYTYNTLTNWKSRNPLDDIYFIVGSDIFATIESWYNYDKLLKESKFIIINRYGFSFDRMFSYIDIELTGKVKDSSLILFDTDKINISSSEIRSSSIKFKEYLPIEVASYIKKKGLYKKRL